MSQHVDLEQYVAVIFTSKRSIDSDSKYQEFSTRMEELVAEQPGYLSHIGFRDSQTRQGITVSYFKDEESIRSWKALDEHLEAQRLGREEFYEEYTVRIATVNREYSWSRQSGL
ncbi:MAG: antibiotic biosynthesis monooxygenase [Candidatus Nanopelagicaceae bacterium]